mmetsp:Transcript_3951/g.3879  ORF Transcript_3951/g.3879 Transcript_3951/m.3879 type:complete len:80 (+) Transcript_3951:76-315(+)
MDQMMNLTQKDRIGQALNKADLEGYIKIIEELKLSERNLQKQVNKLKGELNSQYKDLALNKDKYAKELESNKNLQSSLQ